MPATIIRPQRNRVPQPPGNVFHRRVIAMLEHVDDAVDMALDATPGEASALLADLSDRLEAERTAAIQKAGVVDAPAEGHGAPDRPARGMASRRAGSGSEAA